MAVHNSARLIRLKSVDFSYPGQKKLLSGISYTLFPGDRHHLMGANGVGKSTLLRLLAGDLTARVEAGDIRWTYENKDYAYCPSKPYFCRLVSDAQLRYLSAHLSTLTARQIVGSGMATQSYYLPTPMLAMHEHTIDSILDQLDLMPCANYPFNRLSSGEKAGILLCRGLLAKPRLLILDEMEKFLDQNRRQLLQRHLALSHWGNSAIVIASHPHDGTGFSGYMPYQICQGSLIRQSTSNKAKLYSGADLARPIRSPMTAGRLLVRLKGVNLCFARRQLLEDMHLDIHTHSLWHIQGANGSGKTSLLRLLAGLHRPDLSSRERLEYYCTDTETVTHRPPRGMIGYAKTINATMIEEASMAKIPLWRYVESALQGCHPFFYRKVDQPLSKTNAILADFDITTYSWHNLASLSAGILRKAEIARALIVNPHLLLLDEFFTGLDSQSITALIPVLEIMLQRNLAVVVTSHHLLESLNLARKAILRDGKLHVIAP